jgi:hypothetical protein
VLPELNAKVFIAPVFISLAAAWINVGVAAACDMLGRPVVEINTIIASADNLPPKRNFFMQFLLLMIASG